MHLKTLKTLGCLCSQNRIQSVWVKKHTCPLHVFSWSQTMCITYVGKRISWAHDLIWSSQAKFWAVPIQQGAKHVFGACIEITLCEARADPVSKFTGGNFSNIWESSLMTGSLLYKRRSILQKILLWQNNGRQNRMISRMLFFELYKIMVNNVTFVGFRGGRSSPVDPPLLWRHLRDKLIIQRWNLAYLIHAWYW